jgi:hypothetical protein
MYKFPACSGIGQQRTVHFKRNQLIVERKITVWLRNFDLNQPLSHLQEAFHQL